MVVFVTYFVVDFFFFLLLITVIGVALLSNVVARWLLLRRGKRPGDADEEDGDVGGRYAGCYGRGRVSGTMVQITT